MQEVRGKPDSRFRLQQQIMDLILSGVYVRGVLETYPLTE